MLAVKPMGLDMKRLFLFATVATALNATIAGCAAQQNGTVGYSQVVTDTGAVAALVDGIAGILTGTTAAPVAPLSTATPPAQ